MNNKGFTLIDMLFAIVAVVLVPVCAYGWIHNIIVLYHSSFTPITGQLVLRVAGIFLAPLGVIMGFI